MRREQKLHREAKMDGQICKKQIFCHDLLIECICINMYPLSLSQGLKSYQLPNAFSNKNRSPQFPPLLHTCFKRHHDIIVGVKRGTKRSNKMIHRHWTSKSLLVLWYLFEGIHHLKGSRLLILATNSGQIPNYGPDALDVDGRYRYFENTYERPMVNIHDNAGLCMKDSFWLSLSFSTSSSPFHYQSSITVLPIWASYFLQAKPIPTFRLDSGF